MQLRAVIFSSQQQLNSLFVYAFVKSDFKLKQFKKKKNWFQREARYVNKHQMCFMSPDSTSDNFLSCLVLKCFYNVLKT